MWSVALINIRRDVRRTVATVLAVATSVFGLLMFLAYVAFVERTLSAVVIHEHGNGHVQVYRRGGLVGVTAAPARFSLSAADYGRITRVATSLPGLVLVTPQLEGSGIVQCGDRTDVFLARGVVPGDDGRIKALGRHLMPSRSRSDGDARLVSSDDGVLITAKLGQTLRLPCDTTQTDFLQLSTAAFDSRLNVIDAPIVGEFSTGVEEAEGKGLKMPLPVLQRLYRTDGITRAVLLLENRDDSASYAEALRRAFASEQLDYDVYTWDHADIGKLYASFMGFFTVMFTLSGIVMVVLCLLTIQSTMLMNCFDRVREIGALRAVGFGRRHLARLFARESAVLCAAGGASGAMAALAASLAITASGIETTLPRVLWPVRVDLSFSWQATVGVVTGLAVLVSLFTAFVLRGKLRVPIVNCLQGRFAVITLAASLTASAVPADARRAAPDDKQQLTSWLALSDRARGGVGSYTWTVEILSREPSGTTQTSYRVDVDQDKAIAVTISPASSKGETILILGRAMWFTRPGLRRPVSISPRQRLAGQASNGDIASIRYAGNYMPTLVGEDIVNGVAVHKIHLQALNDKMTYDQVIYYLDKQTHLAIGADLLTTTGKPYKRAVMQYDNRVKVAGDMSPFISSMTISDAHFPDRRSVLTYTNVMPAEHPAARFSLSGGTQ